VAADAELVERRGAFQFSLATVMLVITAAAIFMSIFVMAPGLGIVAALVLTPALVRTCWIAARERARGEPLTAAEKTQGFAQIFAATLGALIVGGMASVIAFFFICLASGPGWLFGPETGIWLGSIGAGGIVGIIVFFYIARWLRENYC
jgi:hypothetical protein